MQKHRLILEGIKLNEISLSEKHKYFHEVSNIVKQNVKRWLPRAVERAKHKINKF